MALKWRDCFKVGAIVVALVSAPGCASFQPLGTFAGGGAVAAAEWPAEAPGLKPESSVTWGKLPNGLRYAIVPNSTPSRSVSIRLHIAAGSLDETEAQRGLAHFLEHMAFNGSKSVPEGEMVKILERFGLAFGPDTNAFTSLDQTVYQLDLPSNGDDIVDQALLLMNETARNLTLAPDAIDRERGVIASEARLRDTPAYRAYVTGAQFVMPNALVTRRMPIGDPEVIKSAGRDQFEELYRRAYRPDRATLIVAGDIDAAKIEQKVKAQFSDWVAAGGRARKPSPGPVKVSKLDAGYFYDPNVKTSVTFSITKQPTNPSDSLSYRKLSFARELANSVLSRRLRALSRQGNAKILGGAAYFDDAYDAADVWMLSLNAEPKNWQDAIGVGEQELRRALSYGFTQPEIDEQLAEMRANFKNAAEYAPTRKTAEVADALVGAAHEDLVYTHPADDLALFEAFAKTASADKINARFKSDWGGAEPKIFLATSVRVDDPRNSILAIYKKSRSTPVSAPETKVSEAFAYNSFGAPGIVVASTDVTDLGADVRLKQVRFANNVRLNIIKTPYERDTVRASLRVCCGRLELSTAQAGLAWYLETVFPMGGLEKHSADELEHLNAGRTASFGIDVDDDAYVFAGVVASSDLDWQLQIWAAELTAPGYREEAQAIFQKNVAVWLESLDATPQSVLSRDLPSILRKGDPRWTIPSREAFEAMKLDDARTTLQPSLASGYLELSLVGDVDEAKAIEMVARTLGALPERQVRPKFAIPSTGLQQASGGLTQTLRHNGPKNRAASVMVWDIDDFAVDPSRGRQLRILSSILNIKLTDELRERLGDTYSPSVSVEQSEVFKGVGFLTVSIDLEPEKLPIFQREINQIVADMANGRINDDEFKRAQKPIIEGLGKSEESNDYWLRVADEAQGRPESLAWHRSRRQDYERATLGQIKVLAKRTFKDKKPVRVDVIPGAD